MESSNQQIESLNKSVEEYERNARRRAWLSSIIPLIFGALLLGYTVWQIQIYSQELKTVQIQLDETTEDLGAAINDLNVTNDQLAQADTDLGEVKEQLSTTTAELESTRNELENLKSQLQEITEQLQSANLFVDKNVEVDFFAIKESGLSGGSFAQEEVLLYILELQQMGVRWSPAGFSLEEGFDSPSFAVYVLQQCDLYDGPADANTQPWNVAALNASVEGPALGDLVYYSPSGFTMFYYELNGESFVIGMTPLGILALEPDFAPNARYLGVPFENYQSCFD